MPKTKIEETIKQKIKKDEIKMKPKYYFALGSLSITLGMIISFIFSAFFINLISHRIRILKMAEFLPMGGPGRMMFLRHFPWHFLFISTALLTVGAWLLKRYDISYKKSFLVILVGIIVSIVFAGLLVDKVGINMHFKKKPGFKRLYKTPPGFIPPSSFPAVRERMSPERKMPPKMYYRQ